jgi:ketopantoate hydroxymethyltransferase
LGLTPRAKEEEEAHKLIEDAKLLERLGCFALVLEKIPAHLAEKFKSIAIPVIGICWWWRRWTGFSYSRYVRNE